MKAALVQYSFCQQQSANRRAGGCWDVALLSGERLIVHGSSACTPLRILSLYAGGRMPADSSMLVLPEVEDQSAS